MRLRTIHPIAASTIAAIQAAKNAFTGACPQVSDKATTRSRRAHLSPNAIILRTAHQALRKLRQLRDIGGDPSRLIAREQILPSPHFFGFSFVDNNTATSCCHGSVLYSGSIFCEI
jgi:hypothetical protein